MRRHFVSQILFFILIGWAVFKLYQNLQYNLAKEDLVIGFGFLKETAGFSIIMHLIDYTENSTYSRVFWVGLLNTLLVSAISIVFATLIGLAVGIARLKWYVEIVRNIPLLLQLFFWYFVVLRLAPDPQHSYSIFNSIFITNRGIYLPTFSQTPVLGNLNYEGGINILPEFLALVVALSVYSAAYIAEIVRLGVAAIPKGQTEAAFALGLKSNQSLRYIILPQALKIMLPLMTNQYLNIIKNSSLAAAIAYPDLVSVFAGTTLNQTGHAVEIIAMTMGVYLFINLIISALMLLYERTTHWGKT